MKPLKTIKYKALLLLVSFSFNSVVGFACSLGIDMGFNSHHHSHGSGKQHEHTDADHNEHDGINSHQHGTNSNHHSDANHTFVSFTSPGGDNCCMGFVVGFHNMDKMVTKNCSSVQQPQSAISPYIVPVITGLDLNKGFSKHFHIPPKEIDRPSPDIIVLVQSFLI